jgi:hypothetical protein
VFCKPSRASHLHSKPEFASYLIHKAESAQV